MAALLLYSPAGRGPESIAKLVWTASQGLMLATREGHRPLAEQMSRWLVNTREDTRCTAPMRRVIDHSLEIALARFGGTPPAFEPLQPDDGEAA